VTDDFFRDPKLARIIRALLRSKGIPAHELEDMAQDVLEALVVWMRKEGVETADGVHAGARAVATNLTRQYWKKKGTDRKHNAGSTDQADESGRPVNPSAIELLDVSKVLGEIRQLVANGALSEKSAAVLTALAEETTLAEHAEETNQSPEAVRKTAERAHRKVVAHLHQRGLADVGLRRLLGGAAAAVAVAVVLFLLFTDRLRGLGNDPVAHHDPDHPQAAPDAGHGAAPPPSARPPEVLVKTEAQRRAEALTLDAEDALKKRDWQRCVDDLRAAAYTDAGDEARLSGLASACDEGSARDLNAKAPRPKPAPTPKK